MRAFVQFVRSMPMITMPGNLILFGRTLSYYILFAFAGLFAGMIVGVIISKKRELGSSFVFRMITGVLLIGVVSEIFVGGIPDFMLPFAYLLGLFFSAFLFYAIGKVFHKNPRDCCEVGLISLNVFMIFSKTGCFFAGCCHGVPYSGLFSVIYPNGSHAILTRSPLFPIQALEVLVRILLLALMLVLFYRDVFSKIRIPLFVSIMANAYFWGMLFWYGPEKLVNQNGIDFVLYFNILFGISTVVILGSQLFHPLKSRTETAKNKKEDVYEK